MRRRRELLPRCRHTPHDGGPLISYRTVAGECIDTFCGFWAVQMRRFAGICRWLVGLAGIGMCAANWVRSAPAGPGGQDICFQLFAGRGCAELCRIAGLPGLSGLSNVNDRVQTRLVGVRYRLQRMGSFRPRWLGWAIYCFQLLAVRRCAELCTGFRWPPMEMDSRRSRRTGPLCAELGTLCICTKRARERGRGAGRKSVRFALLISVVNEL